MPGSLQVLGTSPSEALSEIFPKGNLSETLGQYAGRLHIATVAGRGLAETEPKPMSIHAHLSEEAQARLENQQRNSTITSFIIAILVIVMITLVLSYFLLPQVFKSTDEIVVTRELPKIEKPDKPPTINNQLKRNPTPPSSSPSSVKTLVAHTLSAISIPVPDVTVVSPIADFGDGDDFGPGGIGDGVGDGDPDFEGIRPELSKRCSKQDRLQRLQEMGGTPECEDAVIKTLNWLKATQKADGSWDNQHPVAMTGLALLVFFGHCETPHSAEYGENVLKAITYMVNVGLQNDGMLTNKDATNIQWVYDHGIATYALAEAYTFCSQVNVKIPDLDLVTKKAGDRIMQGQADSGGWVYKFASSNDGDNSVGFWQIQALKACKHTGLWTDSKFKPTIRKAHAWLEKVQGQNGAIGYRSNSATSPGLTGGGVLAFQMWDEGRSRAAKKGIEYLAKNTKFEWGEESANLYYHYYHAQAMINHGGREWVDYNLLFRDKLLKVQNPDGTWTQAGIKHGPVSTHMAACLSALMLEVYYRFLPGTAAK